MLKQFIPSEYCLKCDTCCRFGQKNSPYAPKFLPGECLSGQTQGSAPTLNRHGNIFICQFFSSSTNSCNIYSKRPLDCRLYPLMVTYDKDYENIILVIDGKCPYVQRGYQDIRISEYQLEELKKLNLPHNFVMPYQPDTIKIATIKNLGGFKALALEHKPLFDKYLSPSLGTGSNQTTIFRGTCLHHHMSTRSFVNIYIWSDLFNILWKIVDGNLCVFYEYKNEFNMMIPPIPKSRGTACRAPTISFDHIENIAKEEIKIFKGAGLKIHKNTDEYIYLAKDIAELKGNKYASQRAALNHFVKNNKFAYRPFVTDDIDECLKLYEDWAKQKKNKDSVYQQLVADSFSAQKKAMLNYEELGLIGRIIEVDGKIRAYTFAFKMNPDTYCIIFETTDTAVKGLAQFIFSRLAQELCGLGAKYLNAMDDSGLANLKKTKLSWHPHKILTNYIGVITEPVG